MRAAFAALWASVGGRVRERTRGFLGIGDCKTAGTDRLHLVTTRDKEAGTSSSNWGVEVDDGGLLLLYGISESGKMFLCWSC